jgi:hypothetical protein
MWEAYKTFQDACVGSDKLIQHTFAILGIVVGKKEDLTQECRFGRALEEMEVAR